MDIEQLKLILETLQGLGHEAGNLAVLYLWLHFSGSVLTSVTLVSIFVGLFYFIYRAVRMSYGYDVADAFLRDMRDQLGTGIHGILTDDERQRTLTALRKLVAEAKNKEKKA